MAAGKDIDERHEVVGEFCIGRSILRVVTVNDETDVEAVLTGETFDGTPIRGVDSVRLK